MNPDLINSALELGGACFAWSNVYQVRKDQDVKGVQWLAWCWYVLWGAWELGYIYPTLNQPFTMFFSAIRISANVAWLVVVLRLKLNHKRQLKAWQLATAESD
jgi:hypothetical protein